MEKEKRNEMKREQKERENETICLTNRDKIFRCESRDECSKNAETKAFGISLRIEREKKSTREREKEIRKKSHLIVVEEREEKAILA